MIMADILKIALLIVGTMVVFVSCWLAIVALFPALVTRTQEQYVKPFKLLGIGIPAVAVLFTVAILFFKLKNPVFQLSGSVLIGTVVAIGLAGSTGLARRVGQGLPSPVDADQPWRMVYRGGTVLVLVFLLPLVGWFLILPFTLITGFAAALLSFSKAGNTTPITAAPIAAPAPAPRMEVPPAITAQPAS